MPGAIATKRSPMRKDVEAESGRVAGQTPSRPGRPLSERLRLGPTPRRPNRPQQCGFHYAKPDASIISQQGAVASPASGASRNVFSAPSIPERPNGSNPTRAALWLNVAKAKHPPLKGILLFLFDRWSILANRPRRRTRQGRQARRDKLGNPYRSATQKSAKNVTRGIDEQGPLAA